MSRVCVVYSKVRSGGYSGQCNNRRGAAAMHKDGGRRRTKIPTFAGPAWFRSTASQMRDEALALPLEDRRAASRRSHRARNIDTAMAAAGFAPTQGTITLAQEFEQPSTNQTRATKAGRTTDCGCGGRHAVRHANVMCATQRAPATSADAARTSETPENWIGSRLA